MKPIQAIALLCLTACGQEDPTPSDLGALADAATPSVTLDASAAETGTLDAAPASASTADATTQSPNLDAARGDGAATGTGASASADARADGAPSSSDAASASADAASAGYTPCPDSEPCKILPLGDSITYGIGYAGGYRVELFRKASADKKRITFVGSLQNGPAMVNGESFPKSNEGHSGWTISRIADLVPTPALEDEPHIVLLMAGTNDVNLSSDLANAPKRLGALIDELIAADANTLIIVAQITPLTSRGQGATSPVTAFNAALPELVATRANAGKHVLLVDMNKDFPMGALGDGVHPNRMGYEWMAGVWYRTLSPFLR